MTSGKEEGYKQYRYLGPKYPKYLAFREREIEREFGSVSFSPPDQAVAVAEALVVEGGTGRSQRAGF